MAETAAKRRKKLLASFKEELISQACKYIAWIEFDRNVTYRAEIFIEERSQRKAMDSDSVI